MLSGYITVAQNWNSAAFWSPILSLSHLALYFLWVRFSFFLTIVAELLKNLVSQVLKAGKPDCSLHVVKPKSSRKGASKISSMSEPAGGCNAPSSIPSSSQPLSCSLKERSFTTMSWQVPNCRDGNGLNHWVSALRTEAYQGHSLFLNCLDFCNGRASLESPPAKQILVESILSLTLSRIVCS